MKKITLLGLLATLFAAPLFAQTGEEDPDAYKPLKVNLNESGSKYIRFLAWNQFWFKAGNTNPGYVDVNGGEAGAVQDFALRRARFLAFAQVSPRYMILTHFGVNNQSFTSGGIDGSNGKKPQLYFHDVWNEFKVVDELYIGTGLHYWHGISRLTNASTLNFLTVDAPIFNWPTIELTDQFARQFGFYAKGQIGKEGAILDYRVAVNKPFRSGSLIADLPADQANAVNVANDNWATQGYFEIQLGDRESNKLPYKVGTYIGGKDILNIGVGFHYHPEATATTDANGEAELSDIALFGLDFFYERNLNADKNTYVSLYTVFYNYDFGDNYLRNVGILGLNGHNAQPTIGTGNISYTQLGYGLPKFDDGAQFVPFAAFTYKDFEALDESSFQYDVGMNYFISGHHAKITAQYSRRPVFVGGERDGGRGEFILQTHIFL